MKEMAGDVGSSITWSGFAQMHGSCQRMHDSGMAGGYCGCAALAGCRAVRCLGAVLLEAGIGARHAGVRGSAGWRCVFETVVLLG